MNGGGAQSGGGATTMNAGPSMNGGSVNSAPSINHEAVAANPNEGFSSKGLSMFKDIGNFNSPKPMIDISRPSFENHSNTHSDIPKQEVASSKSIIDINHGKDAPKSLFKDIENFNTPKSMIDISRPYFRQSEAISQPKHSEPEPQVFHELKPEKVETISPAAPRIEEVRPQVTPEVDTDILTQTETRTEIETKPHVETMPEPDAQPEVQPETEHEAHPETGKETATQTETRIETQTETQTKPDAQPEVKTQTKTVTATATEKAAETVLAPELAKQTRVSLKEAKIAIKKAVKKALNKKEKKTVKEKKKKPTIEEKARELFHNRKNEIEQEKEKKQKDPEVLYFEKDKKVNAYREMVTTLAARRLRDEGSELTGSNLAHAISTNILQGDESEIVEGLQEDLSANNVINEISKVGKISDNQTLHRVIREITDRYTAIRLSFNKKTDANKEDARQVYGKSLDKVNANVYEDKSKGKLVEEQGGEVVYVPGKVYEGYSVESV